MTDERQLPKWIVALEAGLLLVVVWSFFTRLEHEHRAFATSAVVSAQEATRTALEMWVDHVEDDAILLATDPDIQADARALLALPHEHDALLRSGIQERLRGRVRRFLGSHGYNGIFVIAPDRVSVASMRDANIGIRNLIDEQRPDLLDAVFRGEVRTIPPIVSDVPLHPERSTEERGQTMFAAAPMRDATGEVFAVLTLRIDPALEFAPIIATGRAGRTGDSYAFDVERRSVTPPRRGNARDFLDLRTPGPRSRALRPTSVHPGERGAAPDGYVSYHGGRVIGAWSWVDSLDVGLVTEIGEAEALESYYWTRRMVAILMVIVGASVFWVVWGLRRFAHTREQIAKLAEAKDLAEQANRTDRKSVV